MRQSIYFKLALRLIILTVLASIITGTVSFVYSLQTIYKLQDDILRQTADFVTHLTTEPVLDLNNKDNQIFIQNRLSSSDKKHFIQDLQNYSSGFHTIIQDGEKYRMYIKVVDGENIAALFDEAEFRDELIRYSILLSTIPILLFVLLIIPLAVWVIYRSLAPIGRLSADVKTRAYGQKDAAALDLTPLDTVNIPKELQGFITAINQLLQKVAQSIKAQQRFIADASHELRSPMTALSLQAERLTHQLTQYHRSDNHADIITQANTLNQSIIRIRHLLEQLLSLARVQADDKAITHTPYTDVSILAIYRQVLADLLPLADDKDIDIGIIGEQDISIHANDGEIYTLIKTLCENAITYTPNGGQVDLSLHEDNGVIIMQVDDNGMGIEISERERVLEPFYRVLGSGEQGTGLGLAIANTLAGRYQGKIVLTDSTRFQHGLSAQVHLPK
ncbi:MAG: ATP-binding protein [Moraxella sp.]|nr:ATP-binding protein [Moraxella sp.]